MLQNYCFLVMLAVLHEVGGEAPSYGGREDSVGSQTEGTVNSEMHLIQSSFKQWKMNWMRTEQFSEIGTMSNFLSSFMFGMHL